MDSTMTADLACRAVAAPGWRWVPGMRVLLAPDIVGRVVDDGSVVYDGTPGYRITGGALPDLDDPATRGCMLALVREAWNARWVCATPEYCGEDGDTWRIDGITARADGATEAEALVSALEVAP